MVDNKIVSTLKKILKLVLSLVIIFLTGCISIFVFVMFGIAGAAGYETNAREIDLAAIVLTLCFIGLCALVVIILRFIWIKKKKR